MYLKYQRRREAAICALLFLTALAPRLYRLGAQSLWLDEGSSWAEASSKGWSPLLLELFSPNAAYPLYHLVLKAWLAVAGDSEVALRLPSALAGALAVPALYLLGRRLAGAAVGLAAALLLLANPFALWQSQDAKAYSLLILCSCVGLLLLWGALERGGRRRWALAIAAAAVALLTHRLSLLLIVGALLALRLPLLAPPLSPRWRRLLTATLVLLPLLGAAGVWLGVRRAETLPAVGASVAPGDVLGQLLRGFAFYRAPLADDQPWRLWPWLLLALWGLVAVLQEAWGKGWGYHRDAERTEGDKKFQHEHGAGSAAAAELTPQLSPAKRGQRRPLNPSPSGEGWRAAPERGQPAPARFMFALCLLPLALALVLMLVLIAQAGLYDARYVAALLPLLLVLVAWPLRARGWPRLLAGALVAAALLFSGAALFERRGVEQYGLFSGEPVKEDYRAAVDYLAGKLHPDDVVIVSPHYLRPLYDYYAARVTADPLPLAQTMPDMGKAGYTVGEFDNDLDEIFAGHNRAWLFEAPDHAFQIDRTDNPQPVDIAQKLGKLAINFRYAAEHRKWACGQQPWTEFLGVRVMCQSFPETYGTRLVPEPGTALRARFGEAIELRGYTLTSFAGRPGTARAGGTLPITLYWRSLRPMREEESYRVFLHLVRQVGEAPVAQEDVPPQEGGLPTSTWRGDPVHDEHAIRIGRDVPPGRYLLLLGLYDPSVPNDPNTPDVVEGRLPIAESGAPAGDGFIELGSVEVVAP